MLKGSEAVKGGTGLPSVGGELFDAERAIEGEGILESINEGFSEVVGAGVQPEMEESGAVLIALGETPDEGSERGQTIGLAKAEESVNIGVGHEDGHGTGVVFGEEAELGTEGDDFLGVVGEDKLREVLTVGGCEELVLELVGGGVAEAVHGGVWWEGCGGSLRFSMW